MRFSADMIAGSGLRSGDVNTVAPYAHGDGHDTRSIQDYLGHKDIRHTVRYTALFPKPFRDFWRD